MLPVGMRGKTRLAKLLLNHHLSAADVTIVDKYGIYFKIPSLREPVAFHLLIDGVYESQLLEFIFSKLASDSVFIDVGANIGAIALPVAQKLAAGGRVLAIEPSPTIFPYLQENAILNHFTNIEFIQKAACKVDHQTLAFYEAPLEKFGMGSLGAQFHQHPIQVETCTLDALAEEKRIRKVDIIKVDVEGFEVTVFEGAEYLLSATHTPIVVFEFCDWAEKRLPSGRIGDAQRLLRKWDFDIWRLADFIAGTPPLREILETGYETLVACKASH